MKGLAGPSRVIGIAALAGGAALVVHILSGVSLRLALVVAAALLIMAGWHVWRRADVEQKFRVARLARVGLVSGLVATLVYDLVRSVLSRFDTSPYDPFEAVRAFGSAIAGPSASPTAVMAAGAAFHLFNGVAFAMAFCMLFRRGGVLRGMAWGAFLEVFQLTLYPGWLDIRAFQEFAQISAVSHLAYGATLGWLARAGIGRIRTLEQGDIRVHTAL
ncbi:MAG: hypothetical protein LC739_04985 [Actinobacteria bacterium]|nr:hypothetical protein [Actinomycetota bacterium]